MTEELSVEATFAQGWGKLLGRLFQFRAKHGVWTFAVFEGSPLDPFDIDLPSEKNPGMYIVQRYTGTLTREHVERQIRDCADAYLAMITT